MQIQPCDPVALCLGLGECSTKVYLIQMLPDKQGGVALTTQLWAIRLSLALPNEGGRRGQQNWQESWGSSAGWLVTPQGNRSLSKAALTLSWPFTEHPLGLALIPYVCATWLHCQISGTSCVKPGWSLP